MALWLHEIAEGDNRILNALVDDQLMELGRVARIGDGTRILDLACGKGEMLCRWAAAFGSTGVGVDISNVFVPAAVARAAELAVADKVSFVHADASTHAAEGVFDVGACIGATWIGKGVTGTIDLLRPVVRPDGLLLIGEPFWKAPPPAELEAAFGGETFTSLPGLLETFDAAGCDLVELVVADEHSFDRYVVSQWWNLRAWLDAHVGDERAPEVRAFLRKWRHVYLNGQRQLMGWGVFVLRH